MNSTRPLVIAVGLILSVQLASAQDMSRYRAYALESSLDAVIATSGARRADAKTLHQRPATIQELQWRAPYVSSGDTLADPVREIAFTFYNDALYQVVVNYDRDRTEGLTNKDILGDVRRARARIGEDPDERTRRGIPDGIVLARWETAESLITLIRGSDIPEFQLILVSKPLRTRARSAIREAIRLDAIEAPRRESEQRKKEAETAARLVTRHASPTKPHFVLEQMGTVAARSSPLFLSGGFNSQWFTVFPDRLPQ